MNIPPRVQHTLHAMIFRLGWVPRGVAASPHICFAEPNGDGPPGPPPRAGLTWKAETQRWVRPDGAEESHPVDHSSRLAVPSDPKKLTVDQANQALVDLGYTDIRQVGGKTGHPDDHGAVIVKLPSGEERELRPIDVKRAIYGDAALPVATKMDAASLSHAFTQTGRGKLLGAAKLVNGKVTAWRVKNPDGGADVILSDDEVRQAVIDSGLARSGKKVGKASGKAAKFAEPSTTASQVRSEVAIAGPDGQRAADLLAASKKKGTDVLAAITEKAVRRLLSLAASTGAVPAAPVLFDDTELKELQDAFQSTIATADLLGRSRVRRFAAKYADIAKFAEGDSGGAWAPYTGPKGGTGWKNGATGEVRYQAEKPGDEESGIADKPDAEVKAEKPKEPKAEKEWDGVINDDDVLHRPRDREQIDTWKEYDDPSEGGHEHSVKVQHGTYTLPNGEDIDVYRWENHRTYNDITEKGEWTKSESEARREARYHARVNHQDAPDPEDSDIPSRLSGPSWRHRDEIDGAAWEGNSGEWHHLRLEEATFEHYGQEHTAYRWTTEHDEDGEWTLSRRRAERDAVRYAEEKQQQFTAFDTNDIPSLAKGADEAKRSTKLGIDELPKSKAKLSVSTTVNSDAMDSILSHLYGDDPVANERMFVQSLGMPDNAKINIVHAGKYDTHYGGDPEPGGVAVKVEIQHPDFKAIRSIGIDEDGNRFIVNHGWFMNKGAQGGGLGAEVFSRSVEAASQHGIDYITTHAAKSPDMNGYATWPKFGYDLPVDKIRDAVVKDELKQLFPAAKTIQDVFKTREGEEWWCGKKNPDGTRTPGNGTDLYGAKFDLDPGSVSMGRLRAYLATKMKASVSPTPSLTTSMPPATPSAPSKPPQTPGKGDAAKFAEPPDRLGPDDDPFSPFPEPIPFQPPVEAVRYFQRLVPSIGTDPYRYGALLERHAFTLAAAADQALLDKVKQAIAKKVQAVVADRLAGVRTAPIGTATADIQDILDAAGVAPANPQYAEMVFRTNMMDAYNAGQTAELATPEMQEFFPVWRYEGILDSRTGDDHRPKIDRYYPSAAVFADVRGPRVWNCRCCQTPIYRTEWAELQAKGARVESSW